MKKHRTFISTGILALVSLTAVPALADDFHCPPNRGAETIDGNILIAAPCRLDGTYVKGNVHMYSGGSLVAVNATIEGSIQAEGSDFVDVDNTRVIGSIQLDNMVGDVSNVRNSRIGGSIQLKSNRSRLEMLGNDVNADIQAFSNTGGVLIEGNIVDGNLQCKSNNPAPVGGGNQVSGNKEDQCANLAPESSNSGNNGSGALNPNAAAGAEPSGGGAMSPMGLLPLLLMGLWRARQSRAMRGQ
jgi:hypothetical protein